MGHGPSPSVAHAEPSARAPEIRLAADVRVHRLPGEIFRDLYPYGNRLPLRRQEIAGIPERTSRILQPEADAPGLSQIESMIGYVLYLFLIVKGAPPSRS